MPTVDYTLTNKEPALVLDGTKAGYIQEKLGMYTRYCVATDKPDIETCCFQEIVQNDMSFPSGFPVWAWSRDEKILVVTVSTEE